MSLTENSIYLCSVLYPEQLLHTRRRRERFYLARRATTLAMAARNAALRRPPPLLLDLRRFLLRLTSNQEVVLYAVDAEKNLSPPGVPTAVEGRT